MVETLILTVLLVSILLFSFMWLMKSMEKSRRRYSNTIKDDFLYLVSEDRRTRQNRIKHEIRMSGETLSRLYPDVLMTHSSGYPVIGYYAEYTILDAPHAEVGAFFFG